MHFSWPSKHYHPVNREDILDNSNEKTDAKQNFQPIIFNLAIFLLIFAAFVAGVFVSPGLLTPTTNSASQLTETAPRIPLKWIPKTFSHNESFATPPPLSGGPEPIWDSLIPNGLGYIKYPPSSPNASVLSAFHQLHCLYTLRRIYYSTGDDLQDFDFGINREEHAEHCFEYLRQSIQCSADSTLEPAGHVEGFLGWGFKRECKDMGYLMGWAEKWRAFDGLGFIARPHIVS